MDKEEVKKLKEELNESFSDDYIRNAGILIHKLAEEFYRENKLEGSVYFNDNIFEYCLIDILVDIARLKHFHDISKVNYIKFIAYTASWCLKRKPFQLIEGCDSKYLYVNEKFALSLLLQAMGYYDDNTLNIASIMKNVINHNSYNFNDVILHQSEGIDLIPSSIELAELTL